MSEKQEKKRRYNQKLAYISAYREWLEEEPPRFAFLRWMRWRKREPKMCDFLKRQAGDS